MGLCWALTFNQNPPSFVPPQAANVRDCHPRYWNRLPWSPSLESFDVPGSGFAWVPLGPLAFLPFGVPSEVAPRLVIWRCSSPFFAVQGRSLKHIPPKLEVGKIIDSKVPAGREYVSSQEGIQKAKTKSITTMYHVFQCFPKEKPIIDDVSW